MSETKWTKGPWKASDQPDGGNGGDPGCYGVREEDGSGYVVADVWSDVDDLEPHAKANALLIAAAPDLYAALEALQTSVVANDLWHGLEDELSAASTALAKARGELDPPMSPERT